MPWLQLQMDAARADPVIRAPVRELACALVDEVRRLPGRSEAELWRFFATGMRTDVVATLGLREIAGEDPWAASRSERASHLHEPPAA